MEFHGSSPRTRGTGVEALVIAPQQRFIPAHAGNRRGEHRRAPGRSVHPRARGEQWMVPAWMPARAGSSPRTRGTVTTSRGTIKRPRFIPAHAGNRLPARDHSEARAVHPRARGEQAMRLAWRVMAPGSSPRTRGTVQVDPLAHLQVRFIPAHAGNRVLVRGPGAGVAVHPRARGEQFARVHFTCPHSGSSPRTRGTAPLSHRLARKPRFIPAHAGNSRPCTRRASGNAVHPRARGEQQRSGCYFSVGYGSSPRTRGTGRIVPDQFRRARFIPAHAGNSDDDVREPALRPVHPRARGEQ